MTAQQRAAGPVGVRADPRKALRSLGRLQETALEERDRWALWLPVILASGIGVYFALPTEPPGWLGAAAATLAAVIALLGLRRPALFLLGIGGLSLSVGFAAAQWRTAAVAAPVLQRDLGPVGLSGRVVKLERGQGRVRLTLEQLDVDRLETAATPARVRISSSGTAAADLAPGDWVRGLAVLQPPPEPAAPGGYDFARRAWFERLGAVGYSLGAPQPIAQPPDQLAESRRFEGWRLFWEGLRQRIAERILAVLPRERGALAVALTVGKRDAIAPDLLDAMRDSGLAHLLAISGLHIGLVAGSMYLGLRRLLACWPFVALRYPIKKWAAVAGLATAFVYLFLAGATIPTQRAFLMVGLIFLGVLLDRSAVSLRLVAWAAAVVLLIAPESLLSASFQMSFAAVVALVSGYEAYAERRARRDVARLREGADPVWRKPAAYFGSLLLSSGIAVAATTTYAWYHFNRFAWAGLAANLAAVPLTAFVVMPAALLAFLAMPFGLEAAPLWLMGQGLGLLIVIARETASWPGAVQLLPALPTWGLVAVTLGGLWLCLWRRAWRYAGVAVIAVGLSGVLLRTPPDLLISSDGGLIAARGPDGDLALSESRRQTFVREQWLRRAAQAAAASWPPAGNWLLCDGAGCIYRRHDWTVALARSPAALLEDCKDADLIVAPFPVPRGCFTSGSDGPRVIDRFDLWRDGGHSVRLYEEGLKVDTVRSTRGTRPWTRHPSD
ncbi:ComEC/Rec2 family competence protein [Algihabitans albus]|uniref:ComEC/Rec2 family competence protein n=1 Tax=Algihabitans albus TaxID=2164067 RepID=UPI000E5CE19A|nr:ComEC/Rec2 family competence protein [Algihabitans albus]